MAASTNTEFLKRTAKERMSLAEPLEGWAEYQSAADYIRSHGTELSPTARLILLALVGHWAPTPQVVYETGACLYAVNKGLAELTKRGLLLRECCVLGRFRHSFYRIDRNFLDKQCHSFFTMPRLDFNDVEM